MKRNGEHPLDVRTVRGRVFRVTIPLDGPVRIEVPPGGAAAAMVYIRALGGIVWALASSILPVGGGK
jgi:hypothetical protein